MGVSAISSASGRKPSILIRTTCSIFDWAVSGGRGVSVGRGSGVEVGRAVGNGRLVAVADGAGGEVGISRMMVGIGVGSGIKKAVGLELFLTANNSTGVGVSIIS